MIYLSVFRENNENCLDSIFRYCLKKVNDTIHFNLDVTDIDVFKASNRT